MRHVGKAVVPGYLLVAGAYLGLVDVVLQINVQDGVRALRADLRQVAEGSVLV